MQYMLRCTCRLFVHVLTIIIGMYWINFAYLDQGQSFTPPYRSTEIKLIGKQDQLSWFGFGCLNLFLVLILARVGNTFVRLFLVALALYCNLVAQYWLTLLH